MSAVLIRFLANDVRISSLLAFVLREEVCGVVLDSYEMLSLIAWISGFFSSC